MLTPALLAVTEWGPVGVWVGALATFLATLVARLAASGYFDRLRALRLRVTFEHAAPWCRVVDDSYQGVSFWVRVGVVNVGRAPAQGCVGRHMGSSTDGVARTDIDPVQLSWAGVPRSESFEPVDLRRGQREFVTALFRIEGSRWRIDTFRDSDFFPGFSTELPLDRYHVVRIALFTDNAETVARSLEVAAAPVRYASYEGTLRSPWLLRRPP
jgi:hypothetical protein